MRADQLLLERQLAGSRSQASTGIVAGSSGSTSTASAASHSKRWPSRERA